MSEIDSTLNEDLQGKIAQTLRNAHTLKISMFFLIKNYLFMVGRCYGLNKTVSSIPHKKK